MSVVHVGTEAHSPGRSRNHINSGHRCLQQTRNGPRLVDSGR